MATKVMFDDAERASQLRKALELKNAGHSNRSAAKMVGIPESTFRRFLKQVETMDRLLTYMDKLMLEAQDYIVAEIIQHPDFENLFGKGYGEKFVLRIHPIRRVASVDWNASELEIDLNFSSKLRPITDE